MKIHIIRHGEVDMTWKKYYNSVSFDKACSTYDISTIKLSDIKYKNTNNEKIYISGLSRTNETALMIFGNKTFYKSELFNEVPLKSFMDTKSNLPLTVWNVIGRIQWLIGSKRQIETKLKTIKRANKAINMLEQENKDCYVVTHGFFAKILIKQLIKRGFKINKKTLMMNNLDEIIAYK